ncbi:MAG: CoA pyrophosphatase [Azoarcus sp.]|jgi:8-oxo-dGTP pyrophosphatase MutT (NUDIX family)|nr:CoA pyrophosphatase [Azoarcus sp.]
MFMDAMRENSDEAVGEFLSRLRRLLARTGAEGSAASGDGPGAGGGRHRPAAVLVPLVLHGDGEDGLTVLLTRRTDHLHHHPGQISFPGGGMEAGDVSAEAAALRETEEEIGLPPERVEVIGRLPDYLTGTGFRVTPVVGLSRPPLALRLDDFEVAEVFEVPLAHFLDPARHQRYSLRVGGELRHFHAMPYGDYFIWGATAGMLMSLYRLLAAED